MIAGARRRYLDVLASIYIYNEHRGYTSIDRVLAAVKDRHPGESAFIAAIEKHRRDERQHYLMFRHYFETMGVMPFAVDKTCGHIDRLIRLVFGCGIDELDTAEIIDSPTLFDQLCRVIMLTEMRGMRQVAILLASRAIRSERALLKIFRVIERDEPSHWQPYQGWLERHGGAMPSLAERAADAWVHRSLIFAKLPLLYLDPGLPRRTDWYDAREPGGRPAVMPAAARPGRRRWFNLPPPDGSRDPRTEDPTNVWLVHPTGRLLLPLALRLRIPANAISVAGFAFGAAAAYSFARASDWRLATLGLVLCTLWLIADGLDGMVARATGTTSAFGRFLDGLCDHVVFALLYIALAASSGTAWAWGLAVLAGGAHVLQSTLYEGERVRFHRRIRGDAGGPAPSAGNPFVRGYDALAGSMDRLARAFDRRLEAAPDPARLAEVYGRRAAPVLRLMALLSNNMRVIAIYLAFLAGAPALFWWFELLPLSLVALAGIAWHRRVERALVSAA